jgi:hypothetical protein
MKLGSVNMIHIYYIIRSMNKINILDEEVTKDLIDYLVKRGYDCENLMELSSKKGGYRRAIHMI